MRKDSLDEYRDIEFVSIRDVEDVLTLYPDVDEIQREKIQADVMQDIQKAERGERIIFGVRNKGMIIGIAQVVFIDNQEIYADGKTRAHIHHVRVSEESRGKGVGSKLMQHAETIAKDRGFTEMTLGVEESNQIAIRFYSQLGYSEFMSEKGAQGEIILGMKKDL